MVDLSNRAVIVTGAASGIGRASAIAMAACGARVVLADIDEAGAKSTLDVIANKGGTARTMKVDVAAEDEVQALVALAVQEFGRLDAAFNNAGIPPRRMPLTQLSAEAWNRSIAVNLTGVFLCMKHQIPAMAVHGKGAIVNTSSVGGIFGHALSSEYCAAKHGVLGLTKSAALEYGAQGIRVNAILPGAIDTGIMNEAAAQNPELERDSAARVIAGTPLRRIGEPREVGALAAWLLSDEASYINGASFTVDGGLSAGRE